MIVCKECGSNKIVKSGIVSGRQRFRCNLCFYHFRLGDKRSIPEMHVIHTMSILLYIVSGCSFREIGRLLHYNHAIAFWAVKEFKESLPIAQQTKDLQSLPFDEVWPYLDIKKECCENLKELVIKHKDKFSDDFITTLFLYLDKTSYLQLHKHNSSI